MAVKDKPLDGKLNRSLLGSLNIIDRCSLAYNAVVVLLVLLFYSRIPHWYLHVLLNIVLIAAVLLVVFAIPRNSSHETSMLFQYLEVLLSATEIIIFCKAPLS